MAHEKIGSPILLADKPLDSRSLRVLFSDRRVCDCANVYFVQIESMLDPVSRDLNDALTISQVMRLDNDEAGSWR